MKILVMAAHGNQGRLLLPRLRAAGIVVRAVRSSTGLDHELLALGADEVMVGDAADRGFVREIVAGVDAIYHVGPTAHPLEREMGFAMVDAAREAGVRHFIYSSVLHSIASKIVQHKIKRDVEEYLIEANIGFTVLQPADYMLAQVFSPTFTSGIWEQVYDIDRRQAMVALEDVADVVVKVAREREAHFGATYQLCAPGNHSGCDIAEAFARVTGDKVEPMHTSPDVYFQRYYGVGQGEKFRHQLAVIRSVGLWYSQYDFAGNPNVLTWLLGRSPTTLDEFIAREWRKFQDGRQY